MIIIDFKFIVLWVSLLALFIGIVRGQLPPTTTTITETRTVTQVVVYSSDYVCAKIVNVTSVCRRRRGFKWEEPVVLTFDEELGDQIDAAFNQQFILPSNTLSVEATPVATILTDEKGVHLDPNSKPEISSSRTDRAAFKTDGTSEPASSRIFFAQINAFFNGVISQVLGLRSTVTVTATNVFTVTSTTTTGSSTSFFVMHCTPSPFPYSICTNRRR